MTVPYPPLDGSEPCRATDPEAFFPETGSNGTTLSAATALCTTCHVQAACAFWGLHHERYGVFGGTTAHERRHIRPLLGITCDEPPDHLPREYRRTAA